QAEELHPLVGVLPAFGRSAPGGGLLEELSAPDGPVLAGVLVELADDAALGEELHLAELVVARPGGGVDPGEHRHGSVPAVIRTSYTIDKRNLIATTPTTTTRMIQRIVKIHGGIAMPACRATTMAIPTIPAITMAMINQDPMVPTRPTCAISNSISMVRLLVLLQPAAVPRRRQTNTHEAGQ